MNYLYIALAVFIIFMVYGITMVIRYSRKRKLSEQKRKHFHTLLKRALKGLSEKEKIVDMDKLFHKILMELGYEGTFGEILKVGPAEIDNIQLVWDIHKLRNKLVHDFDEHDEKYLRRQTIAYKTQLEKLLSNTK